MADSMLGNAVDIAFVNRNVVQGGGQNQLGTVQNYTSTNSLRSRLTAANSYFTTAILNTMTTNDMVYALRLTDDPTTI